VLDLFRLLGGAVAVVTGRPLSDIDRHLGLPDLPVAGSHGLEVRSLRKNAPDLAQFRPVVEAVLAELNAFAEGKDGLLVEEKPAGAALHYRARPELAAEAAAVIAAIAGNQPSLEVIEGKMVFELRPRGTDKGTAVRRFMAQAPFAGRLPVFIGDDRTDEDAFTAVQEAGGFAIKIGDDETVARYRVATAAEARALMAEWKAVLSSSQQRAIA
jgi:trehalose 6-phosphate phosphatase